MHTYIHTFIWYNALFNCAYVKEGFRQFCTKNKVCGESYEKWEPAEALPAVSICLALPYMQERSNSPVFLRIAASVVCAVVTCVEVYN
jgi:hypothetical protein